VAIRRPKADFGSYFEGILHFFFQIGKMFEKIKKSKKIKKNKKNKKSKSIF
jgi:hypothetical protein